MDQHRGSLFFLTSQDRAIAKKYPKNLKTQPKREINTIFSHQALGVTCVGQQRAYFLQDHFPDDPV